MAKIYCPNSIISVVSKVSEKLVNNRLFDHLEKCDLFSDFQYGFRSSWSTSDLLTVKSDRIVWAFDRSGATVAVAPDISKAFDMLVFFANLSLQDFQARYLALFCLFSVIDGFKWFWMWNLHKNIQSTLGSLKAPFLVQHFSCYTIMTFLMMLSVILLSLLRILLAALSLIKHLTCGHN